MKLEKYLKSNSPFFIIWCIIAAFGTYFCMYAFRKPFSSGLYAEYTLYGLSYKSILVISQVIGYMLSKFVGIKVISELKPQHRVPLIIGLIVFAELCLFCFGLTPFPYNFMYLVLNGLPLGMVWGVVFSFLEGRKVTEYLAIGLSLNLVVTSGFLKTIYFWVKDFTGFDEFWLPFTIGLLFLPLFFVFVWMLSKIPKPSSSDEYYRAVRKPMTADDKKSVIAEYGIGLFFLVLIYAYCTVLRDLRDNFSVEIWKELDSNFDKSVFSKTESIVGFIVLLCFLFIAPIRNNLNAFMGINGLIFFSILLCGGSTSFYEHHWISPFAWVTCIGIALFLPYLAIQTMFFERMIALFRIKGNAGYLVYLCDSMGYLGSVMMLLIKEFFIVDKSWLMVLIKLCYSFTAFGMIFFLIQFGFFVLVFKKKSVETKSVVIDK